MYTAATVGTVLPGVTRRSCIELLKDWGYEVVEGKIAIADIMAAAREGKLEEVFGTILQESEAAVPLCSAGEADTLVKGGSGAEKASVVFIKYAEGFGCLSNRLPFVPWLSGPH